MVKEIISCSWNWFIWNYLPYVILLFLICLRGNLEGGLNFKFMF